MGRRGSATRGGGRIGHEVGTLLARPAPARDDAGRALRAALARAGALRRAGLRLRLRRGAPLPAVRELDAFPAGLLHRRGRADPPPAPRADGLHRAPVRPLRIVEEAAVLDQVLN